MPIRSKGLLLILSLALMLPLGCAGSKSPVPLVTEGVAAPYTRVRLLDGEYVPLIEFAGRPIVLFFWATTCSRSRARIGGMAEWADAVAHDATFLAISLDEDRDALEEFFEERKGLEALRYAWSGNAEADETYYSFGLREIPAIVVIDAQGMVRGVTSSVEEARELLSTLRIGHATRVG